MKALYFLMHLITLLTCQIIWAKLFQNGWIMSDAYFVGALIISCAFWLAWTIERNSQK